MISKWIVLDEIELKLVEDVYGRALLFKTEKEAIEYAEKYSEGWQIIEVPFGE